MTIINNNVLGQRVTYFAKCAVRWYRPPHVMKQTPKWGNVNVWTPEWLEKDEFIQWMKPVAENNREAYCRPTYCKKTISVASMGINAVKSHMHGASQAAESSHSCSSLVFCASTATSAPSSADIRLAVNDVHWGYLVSQYCGESSLTELKHSNILLNLVFALIYSFELCFFRAYLSSVVWLCSIDVFANYNC